MTRLTAPVNPFRSTFVDPPRLCLNLFVVYRRKKERRTYIHTNITTIRYLIMIRVCICFFVFLLLFENSFFFFLRMLKCLVVPIVFINVITSMVDMMSIGEAGNVGLRTVVLYLGTTITAGINACIFSALFLPLYENGAIEENELSYVSFGCVNSDFSNNNTASPSSFLMQNSDGTVGCSSNITNERDILFTFQDVNNTFLAKSGGNSLAEISLSDSLYKGIFQSMVPENLFQEFYNANFGALIGTLCFIFFFHSILFMVRIFSLNTLTLLLFYVPVYLTSFIPLLLVFAIAMGIAVAKVIEMQKLNASNLRYVLCITTNCISIFYIAHHSTSQLKSILHSQLRALCPL